ncbi:MAG: pilus assembly protein PilM, partial [Syntrophomonadaceae bacterium]|nr:pilus assembly protein PilM [Syntrophomonadaceae bacterium]
MQGKKTISVISGSQIYIKNIIMPKMKLSELRQAVYYEATTFLPIPVEETVIDIFPLRNFESETGTKTEVFFAAARREQVENLEACCKIARLDLSVVDLEPLAISRIIEKPEKIESFALLNIEDTRSIFSVFKGENLLF